MSARDDYPLHPNAHAIVFRQWTDMTAEIDTLRAWKEEAIVVIKMWEQCYDAVEAKGSHALPGEFKSNHVLKWITSE